MVIVSHLVFAYLFMTEGFLALFLLNSPSLFGNSVALFPVWQSVHLAK